jgi:hypothetical protein
MLASAGVVIATPASADVHTPACSLQDLVNVRVAQLHPNVPFEVGVTRPDAFAITTRGKVVVSRETPCDSILVTSIVNHEYVHTLQYAKYPRNHIPKEYDAEGVADCGSRMLGSEILPYIHNAPCSDVQLTEVRDLLKLRTNVSS